MALGDITWDRMDLFTPLYGSGLGLRHPDVLRDRQSRPRLTLPGLIQSKVTEESYAERIYEDHFGPYNYSFNVGGCIYHHLKRY